ncbi:MAG: sigma-70 family RNA polymerase sigma factor [Bacilli bacterium]
MENEKLVELVMGNDKMIWHIVNMFPWYKDSEDLYNIGVIGLKKAYDNFDETRNVKFSTYAFPYILGEIRKYVREDKPIKMSRNIQRLAGKIEEAKAFLNQHLMRESSLSELSLYLEIEEDALREALSINNIVQSLDEPIITDGKELTLYDSIQKEENIDLLDLLALKDEMEKLKPHEKKILYNRYYNDLTQAETASLLGITQVQVSRQEQKIYEKLREGLH